jgi:NADH-quinone oxidoreductase subunit C
MAETTDKPAPPPAPPAPPAAPAAPPARTLDEIVRDPLVASAVSPHRDAVVAARDFAGEITLTIQRDRIREVAESFKRDGFKYLVDLSGLDYSKFPGHTGERFAVAYMLYSHAKNQRVRLKVFTPIDAPVPSVTSVWKTANWMERETFDMFGIPFDGHPNLERILMWDGFNGHPLRKDFPVRGIDTGARIYPEVFPPGGGPKAGSTGKDVKDVNLFKSDWDKFGRSPIAQLPPAAKAAPAAVARPATPAAAAPKPAAPAVAVETAEEEDDHAE